MIQREYKDVLDCWHGLTRELSYSRLWKCSSPPTRWGVCRGYPDIVECQIEDLLKDRNLHLDMCSYTKSRWTRFLRRYFRPDLPQWVDDSMDKLRKYPSRPFVASYSINLNPESKMIGVGAHGGHNYGGCLSSVQMRIKPTPEIILYSRACQVDKIGFLDLTLMHLIAKRMGVPKVKGRWIISLCFISAVSMAFYVKRFNLPLKGNILTGRIENLLKNTESEYGPLKRTLKRNREIQETGTIPGSVPVRNLSLEFQLSER